LKHKLLLINLLLLALVAASGSVLRQKWRESKAREESVLKQKAAPVPAPVIAPIPAVPPAPPAVYADVAQKVLVSKDRNPNVFVEPPPPPPAPPVMPPLPFAYGVMDFGAGPSVMLAEKSGGQQHTYRIGDKVGPFKLLGVNRTDILFDWDGKPVQKKLSELVDRNANAAAERAAAEAPKQTAAAPPAAAPAVVGEAKPGKSMGGDAKACQPGDTAPAGTIADGFRKVVSASPFGQVCRWEPVK
jgi:hypothetical protein